MATNTVYDHCNGMTDNHIGTYKANVNIVMLNYQAIEKLYQIL